MKTYFQTKADAEKNAQWVVVDAADIPLGRLATKAASLLRGKHRPTFTPHVNGGDFVVVTNASKVKLTGNKTQGKRYFHHTGFIGGIKEIAAGDLLAKNPTKLVRMAIEGMLPKGALGHQTCKRLKVYSGAEHPHAAQFR